MDIWENAELEVDLLAVEIMFHQRERGEDVDYDKARKDAIKTIKQDREHG